MKSKEKTKFDFCLGIDGKPHYSKCKVENFNTPERLKILEELISKYGSDVSLREMIYVEIFHDGVYPRCKTCDSLLVYKKGGFSSYCSRKCSFQVCEEKRKETWRKKYGTSHPAKTEIVKEKIKNTVREKYGVDNAFQSEKSLEAKSKNNLEKYGVENHFSSRRVIEKVQSKRKDQMNLIQDKIKKTVREKYGVDCVLSSGEIRDKIKATLVERYGVNHNSRTQISKSSFAETMRKKFVEKITFPYKHMTIDEMYNELFVVKNMYLDEASKEIGLPYSSTVALFKNYDTPVKPGNFGKAQKEFAEKIDANIVSNDRKVLVGKEIDIWVPEYNLGIEYCGVYWHSSKYKKPDYHKEKYELSRKAGITLLQFWETEAEEKNDIVMSMINNHLGKSQKIFARKCQIKEISSKEHSEFCERNHLQGKAGASVKIGLFHQDTLVSVMSFGKSRFSKKHEWEMIRYCSLLNHNIVGGASKMWKYFLKTHQPASVVTYADARISHGKLYETLGFSFSHHSGVSYVYVKYGEMISRFAVWKSNIKNIIEQYDPDKSEEENMNMNNYTRLYDAGNLVYEYKRGKND